MEKLADETNTDWLIRLVGLGAEAHMLEAVKFLITNLQNAKLERPTCLTSLQQVPVRNLSRVKLIHPLNLVRTKTSERQHPQAHNRLIKLPGNFNKSLIVLLVTT